MFGLPVQNDSHEYLVYLLDHFHEAMRQEAPWTPLPLSSDLPPEQNMRRQAHNGWYSYLSKNMSPIVYLFFGMMRKTVECQTCHTKTYQWEVFNSLKIPCEGTTFLEWIQREASERSEIEGYRCETCKDKRTATLSSHLWQLPHHLFITLRRFQYNGQKNMIPCPYRGEPLSFDPFFAPESNHESRSMIYEVRGISDHHGSHGGGHYSAQFMHPLTGEWWNMDDQTTQPLSVPRFSASNYIFYFRRNTPPSSSPSPSPSPKPSIHFCIQSK
jgi:ubiquitin C-terminal hydrolase